MICFYFIIIEKGLIYILSRYIYIYIYISVIRYHIKLNFSVIFTRQYLSRLCTTLTTCECKCINERARVD